MKTWKLISMLLLAFVIGACDDDPAGEEGNREGAETEILGQASVFWGYESKTVLKNTGQISVPVKLERAVGKAVKVTVAVQQSDEETIAREGVDFDIPEKVVTIPAGDTLAFLAVNLLDNGKVETDRKIVLNLTGVYDGKITSPQTCSLHIVNNAFVEFQYKNRETYEAAGSYKIPVLVTGDIQEATTFTVRVKEGGTAMEGTHFTLPQTLFTLEKGATSAEVTIELVDDTEANADRWFDLEMVSVNGSNAVVGKSGSVCRVTIISEEVLKSVAFGATEYSVEEGKDLHIPIVLDKAPASGEADVEVTFSVKVANSTANEGEDFSIIEKTLRFIPGQKEDELVISTVDNELINENKTIELSFKAAVGANIGTPDICRVTILNNDFPVFKQAAYTVEEDYGDFVLPVELPAEQPADVHLIVKVFAKETAKEGKHFTLISQEVIIPAGQTDGEVNINIGHELEWTGTPEFKVYIEEIDGIVLGENICSTTISLTQCTFRKLLGNWQVSFTSAIGADAATAPFILNFVVKTDADFNKLITCSGSWTKNTVWQFTSHLAYNPDTKKISAVTNEVVMTQRPFGDTKDIKFYSYSTPSALSWDAVNNGDYTELSWSGYWSTGIYDKGTSNKTGDWMHFQNIKMVKQ